MANVASALSQAGVPFDRPSGEAAWTDALETLASTERYALAVVPGYLMGSAVNGEASEKLRMGESASRASDLRVQHRRERADTDGGVVRARHVSAGVARGDASARVQVAAEGHLSGDGGELSRRSAGRRDVVRLGRGVGRAAGVAHRAKAALVDVAVSRSPIRIFSPCWWRRGSSSMPGSRSGIFRTTFPSSGRASSSCPRRRGRPRDDRGGQAASSRARRDQRAALLGDVGLPGAAQRRQRERQHRAHARIARGGASGCGGASARRPRWARSQAPSTFWRAVGSDGSARCRWRRWATSGRARLGSSLDARLRCVERAGSRQGSLARRD